MTRRQFAWAILVAAAMLLFWQVSHRRAAQFSTSRHNAANSEMAETQPQPPRLKERNAGPLKTSTESSAEAPVAADATAAALPATPPAPAALAPVPDTPESSSLPAATVLENMRMTLRQYLSAFGENPVGTNPEITSALQGDNPKHINFLKQDGNRTNANGELVDVWGTPYFFHQISGHEMEIRSAGPDRVMYTGDDLVTK